MYILIAPCNVEAHWPSVCPWIAQAVGPEVETRDLEHIKSLAVRGLAQIWVSHTQDDKIEMVLVTETVFYGERRTLVLQWLSGENHEGWMQDIGLLEDWAKKQGYHRIEIAAVRRGWERLLKPHGYHYAHTVLRRDVDRVLQ